ncbi:biotin-dependent carboxyltransferase family protein [Streptomyces sp. NPDC055105]|uniref:biotin-dependent carboxyltransferase family protein n=1 Tax=Streptomyces sp. NPDC055105 TaxID=3365719 RepID=UPI0037D80E05
MSSLAQLRPPGRLTVVEPGMLSLVQDRGRPGYAHLGVGRAGAADLAAMVLANRVLGNDESAPVVEVTNGGLAFTCDVPSFVAVTGAPLPVKVGARRRWTHEVLTVAAGEVVALGMPHHGLRSYVAVRGGICVPPVLGSCSTDRLSGLGPERLRAGATLGIGPGRGRLPVADLVVAPPPPDPAEDVRLPVRLGPRADWFEPEALRTLLKTRFEVTPDSDRVGVRLAGPALPRRILSELTSEGVVEGSLQAPPGGRLTLFGPDHPVTGGYPVIAVVRERAMPVVAQLRPGQGVRFVRG